MQRSSSSPSRGLLRRLAAGATPVVIGLGLVVAPAPSAQAAGATGTVVGPAGKCLTDANNSSASGNPIVLSTCNDSTGQTWNVPGDKTLRVFGKCLDVKNGATAPGTRVQLWDCNGSAAQSWERGPNYSLKNTRSGLCLDSVNAATNDGNPLQIWTCNGTYAQQWVLPTGTGGGTGGTLSVGAIGAQVSAAGVASGLRPSAAGGTGQYQWSASGLPAGMSVNYINGTLMGAPKSPGTSTVTMTVTDEAGASASKSFSWTVNAPQTGTDWYLDCSAGSNGSGSQASPFNALATVNAKTFGPGDRLLLKKGSVCNGQLAPKGSGTAAAPITLSSYGTGNAPLVAGGGLVNAAAVQLTNQSYWIVENLEVTNDAATEARRSGINVYGTDGQVHHGITIRNNNVHDVKGWSNRSTNLDSFYLSHGIGVDTPVRGSLIKGLAVVDNYVHEVRAVGIGLYGDQSNWNNNEERHENVLIARNTVRNTSQDGIVVSVSDAPLIEHNVADRLGWNHTDGVYAGIWGWGNTDPTFQYNEVSNILVMTDDSVAWDCDGFNRGTCTYQYNYDHDNANGILLTCASCGGAERTKVVFRYNVSVGDCRLHNYTGTLASYAFYGNTIDCRNKNWDFNEVPDFTAFTNNVFLGKGGSALPAQAKYKANTYVGFTAPSDPQGSTADPALVGANGTAPYGIHSLGGYQLLSGSASLGSGAPVTGNRGTDYWGNALNLAAPNRGAYGGSGVATPVRVDDNAATFSGTWTTTGCSGCAGGSARTGTSDGASASYTFTGRTLSLFGVQSGAAGIAKVSIDGGPAVEVDLYTPGATANGQRIYTSPQLAAGTHTVTVTRTGLADPRSTGTAITLDGYAVS
ncbi:ricin-type beta-trefoil lectin domain protein [Kitasatospora sp. NPDC096147]|uniref:ricin-type beta-trefoil lectin domain protein n=1 Tax=Kitasatospora sp. NPDC096147 TaxID=3364093 RepID=UPI003809F0D9